MTIKAAGVSLALHIASDELYKSSHTHCNPLHISISQTCTKEKVKAILEAV